MKERDWQEYKTLYADYERTHDDWADKRKRLRGAFSELARDYAPGTLDRNRLVEEHEAHRRFLDARERLHEFLGSRLKNE